jgi:UDP-N-acetylmuramoyl-L-alanyl-D-glutamate--2,6-diaminopimelate ligase
MFGSAGGRRDPAKRPIQGEIAGRYADEVVLTEEDDRDTDGMQILEEIANGAIGAGKQRDTDMFLVHDRSEAIAFSLAQATGVDDVVMLLGKGHEKSIERADGEYPWNETEEARKALRRLTKR